MQAAAVSLDEACHDSTAGTYTILLLRVTLLLLLQDQRERYVFFSFPHIAIDMNGELGGIYRPNRPGRSCACGALQKVNRGRMVSCLTA